MKERKWYSGKKVMVTGSSGFIGKNLVNRLKSEGAQVTEISRQLNYDITNWDCIKSIRKIDVIFHLAALSFIPLTQKNPMETINTNVLGTLNILELCRLNKAKMIFTSSYIYGEPKYLPINEEHPLNPSNIYSQSKLMGENLCKTYNKEYDIDVVILRLFNTYGKNQKKDFLIPSIISQCYKGQIKLRDPFPKRDFININDVVQAYIQAGMYNKNNFIIFNIGSGKSYSVRQIVEIIYSQFKPRPKLHYSHKRRKNEIMETIADISFANSELNWTPQVSLEKGIKEII